MKLPRPKESKEIFYCRRIGNQEIEDLLDFGLRYSIGNRQLNLAADKQNRTVMRQDKYLNKAITLMKKMGFNQGKIMHIIAGKMNKIKFGVESYRVMRRANFSR